MTSSLVFSSLASSSFLKTSPACRNHLSILTSAKPSPSASRKPFASEGYANIFRCVADKQAQNGRFSLWLWLSLRTHGGPQFLGAEGFRPRLYHSFDRRKQAFASHILQTTNRLSRPPATSIISECPPSSLNPHASLLPATSPSS